MFHEILRKWILYSMNNIYYWIHIDFSMNVWGFSRNYFNRSFLLTNGCWLCVKCLKNVSFTFMYVCTCISACIMDTELAKVHTITLRIRLACTKWRHRHDIVHSQSYSTNFSKDKTTNCYSFKIDLYYTNNYIIYITIWI